MSESRQELLAWLNSLLELQYTKIEQAGTGAAYCQIMDSVFGDVKVEKVKFDTKHEYEYVANFKVLQHTFDKHKIDKVIPVDRLVKCRFQDNLEFMQWVKAFWDQHFPGGPYDAFERRQRKKVGGTRAPVGGGAGGLGRARVGMAAAAARPQVAVRAPVNGRTSAGSGNANVLDSHSASMIIELNKQISEYKITVDGLEKERDFYFNKLREIEILVQEELERADNDKDNYQDSGIAVLQEIQAILYNTEEGFEVPEDGMVEPGIEAGEDETF